MYGSVSLQAEHKLSISDSYADVNLEYKRLVQIKKERKKVEDNTTFLSNRLQQMKETEKRSQKYIDDTNEKAILIFKDKQEQAYYVSFSGSSLLQKEFQKQELLRYAKQNGHRTRELPVVNTYTKQEWFELKKRHAQVIRNEKQKNKIQFQVNQEVTHKQNLEKKNEIVVSHLNSMIHYKQM